MYKLCIFDLDGTLADTVESIARVGNMVLEHFGLPPQPVRDYNYFAGDGVDMALKRALAAAGDTAGVHYREGKTLFRKWFDIDTVYHVKPLPGICPVLETVKSMGIEIAVFSNKPHLEAVHVVETIFGKNFFSMIQGQTEEIPRKPSPDGALYLAKKLGVKPGECLYLGDTNTDMDTGRAAGMDTVGVTWGFRPAEELREHHARFLIDYPEQILEILEDGKYA